MGKEKNKEKNSMEVNGSGDDLNNKDSFESDESKANSDNNENKQSNANNSESNSENNSDENNVQSDHVGDDIETLKADLEEKTKKCEEYFDLLQRKIAEFDNYRKRTLKEKDLIYTDAVGDVVAAILPVVDNFERAIASFTDETSVKSIKEGIEMVFRQLKDILNKLGVKEIESLGQKFDPHLHNAVMHIEDDSYGENIVVEEFQKGYMLNDKVIRHSMVKVAN